MKEDKELRLVFTGFTCVNCGKEFACKYGCSRSLTDLSKNNCSCIDCFGKMSNANDHIKRGLYCFGNNFFNYITEEERNTIVVEKL